MHLFNHETKRMTIICLIVSFLLFANYFFATDYIALMCTVFMCALILVCKEKYVLPLMLYFSLFAYIIRFDGVNTYFILCCFFITRVMVKNKRNLLLTLCVVPCYIFYHLLATQISKIGIGTIAPFVILLSLFFACLYYKPEQQYNCVIFFIMAFVVSSILGAFRGYNRLDQILEIDTTFEQTIRYAGLSYDPNFYLIPAVMIFCICIFSYGIRRRGSLAWIILSIFTLSFGLITYSKSGALCFVAAILFAIVTIKDRDTRKLVWKLIFIIVLLVLIFYNPIMSVIDLIWRRFTESSDNINDFTTGRYDLWVMYIEKIFSSLEQFMIGNGRYLPEGMKAAHNIILEILFNYGMIGLMVDVLYIYLCVKSIKDSIGTFTIKNISIVTLFVAQLFALSAYTYYSLWACAFICIIIIKEPIEESEKLDKCCCTNLQCRTLPAKMP